MIKVYLDLNTISNLKNGIFTELSDILSDKNKFFIPYSTSHLSDLNSSIKEGQHNDYINSDLEFIATLTDNFCFVNNGNKVVLEEYHPKQIFNNQINYDSSSFDSLFKSMPLDEIGSEIINTYINVFKSIRLDSILPNIFSDQKSVEEISKLFPGFEKDRTFYGLMNGLIQMYHNINETEDYKILRDQVQKFGINNSHFNPGKNPFELINASFKKNNISEEIYNVNFENTEASIFWFNKIINSYIVLDLHGFKADKIKITHQKKNTFKNIGEDANHSAFASLCDIYITDDDKNFHKTKAVYKELSISTYVFKPNEFIEFYNNNLSLHGFI